MACAISVDFWKKYAEFSKTYHSPASISIPGWFFMKALLYLSILLLMLYFPDLYIPSAYNALKIWGTDVVPSLFPYMVFCRLLAEQLKHTQVSPVLITAFLGLLGGSPSGASILSVYGSTIPMKLLFPLATLTGTISPTFILHTANQWLGDPSLCRALFVCCTLGSVAASITVYGIISILPERPSPFFAPYTLEKTQESPVWQSIHAILNIGGCIVIYSVVSVFVCRNPFLASHPTISSFIHASMEMSGGIHALALLPSTPLRPYLLCAAASFSGFSILAQNAYFLRPLQIRMRHQFLFSLLRMTISVCLMAVYQQLC